MGSMFGQQLDHYLLSIEGTLDADTLESARKVHNETAGAPENVAAARSLGDLSHMVYIPADQSGPEAGRFLILDIWNDMEGLNKFFANPTVQEQAGMIFSQRDPVVWSPSEDFLTYHLPAPHGKNDRYIGIVRGMLPSREQSRTVHNRLVTQAVNEARAAGNLYHKVYFRLAQPGSPASLEFLAVDSWLDLAAMTKYYQDPDFQAGFQEMFAAPPATSVWNHPAGLWVEW
jgi:quinol monooxygenase YgiN